MSDARLSDPHTSHEAAAVNPTGRALLRTRIIERLAAAGVRGMTDDELCMAFPDEVVGSVSKRRLDAVRAGVVVDTGRRRMTSRNCKAIVWAAA